MPSRRPWAQAPRATRQRERASTESFYKTCAEGGEARWGAEVEDEEKEAESISAEPEDSQRSRIEGWHERNQQVVNTVAC